MGRKNRWLYKSLVVGLVGLVLLAQPVIAASLKLSGTMPALGDAEEFLSPVHPVQISS